MSAFSEVIRDWVHYHAPQGFTQEDTYSLIDEATEDEVRAIASKYVWIYAKQVCKEKSKALGGLPFALPIDPDQFQSGGGIWLAVAIQLETVDGRNNIRAYGSFVMAGGERDIEEGLEIIRLVDLEEAKLLAAKMTEQKGLTAPRPL
jgi:hypothetical protein